MLQEGYNKGRPAGAIIAARLADLAASRRRDPIDGGTPGGAAAPVSPTPLPVDASIDGRSYASSSSMTILPTGFPLSRCICDRTRCALRTAGGGAYRGPAETTWPFRAGETRRIEIGRAAEGVVDQRDQRRRRVVPIGRGAVRRDLHSGGLHAAPPGARRGGAGAIGSRTAIASKGALGKIATGLRSGRRRA